MSKRVVYYSRIKALACIAVVLLHTFYAAAAFAKTPEQLNSMLAVRNAMSWAVPCFVMVTGALLLDNARELTYKKLFSRHIAKMVLALVIFTLLFTCFDAVFVTKNFSFSTITKSFEIMVYGGGWKHVWYLYLMIALYLLMPAYRLVTKSAKQKDIIYLVTLYTVFLCVLSNVDIIRQRSVAFYICTASVYPLYLFLGYALSKKMLAFNSIAADVMLVLGAALTIYMTLMDTKYPQLLENYSFLAYASMAAGVFTLMQRFEDKKLGIIDKIAAELEKCSFGIYLIHMIFLKVIFVVFRFDPLTNGGAVTVLGISIAAVICSYIITRLLKLLPFADRVL